MLLLNLTLNEDRVLIKISPPRLLGGDIFIMSFDIKNDGCIFLWYGVKYEKRHGIACFMSFCEEDMKQNSNKREVQFAFLLILSLTISSFAALISPLVDSYYLKVFLVKGIYALSYLVSFWLWKRSYHVIGDGYAKHKYCEYKLPAFFVAFAAVVAFLQINIVLLEMLSYSSDSSPMPSGFLGYVFSLIMFVILPAYTEELFFRGVLLKISGGGFRAALLSGIVFGLCHFNLSQYIYAVGSGIVFAFLYIYTDDFKLCVILHTVINFTVMSLSYLSRTLSVGWYVFIECLVWLCILSLGVYYSYILLRDYGHKIAQKTEDIKNKKGDIGRGALISKPMIVCYSVIALLTVLRFL